MDEVIIHLNYLGESSQQELDAYRKLGSVYALRRLKRQEMQRAKRLNTLCKVLKNFIVGACLSFDIWVLISWIDIVSHNTRPNPVYQVWNFFTLFFN